MTKVEILYQGFKQKTLPNINWHMTGDMSSRMDSLQLMFKGIKTITELRDISRMFNISMVKVRTKKIINS
jgi:hypothetical protein